MVEHNGEIAIGETVISPLPRNVRPSSNEFIVATATPFDTSSLTVSWEGENASYFVLVENLETVRVLIDQTPLPGRLSAFRSRSLRGNSFSIRRDDLAYFGEHRVKVYLGFSDALKSEALRAAKRHISSSTQPQSARSFTARKSRNQNGYTRIKKPHGNF